MAAPWLKVGDLVRVQVSSSLVPAEAFLDAIAHDRPSGIFEIVRVLPEMTGGQRQYRIRGGDPPHERVVRECQLVPAVRTPQPRR